MDFRIDSIDGVSVLRVAGEWQDDGRFVEAATNLLTARGSRLVVDLTNLQFINSSGLSELVRVVSQARLQESRVVLANPSAFVAGVFHMTQLDRFFDCRATVAEAVARARE